MAKSKKRGAKDAVFLVFPCYLSFLWFWNDWLAKNILNFLVCGRLFFGLTQSNLWTSINSQKFRENHALHHHPMLLTILERIGLEENIFDFSHPPSAILNFSVDTP